MKNYKVVAGDDWHIIAARFNTTTDKLFELNPGHGLNVLYEGETLRVPA